MISHASPNVYQPKYFLVMRDKTNRAKRNFFRAVRGLQVCCRALELLPRQLFIRL
jgi:hypothetical protein